MPFKYLNILAAGLVPISLAFKFKSTDGVVLRVTFIYGITKHNLIVILV